ncbi:hypothetical protein Pint_23291 [Pistacia integerrima]|uniref:Uncharacterized protein n=1 Tax=Pistacia integerrima TaxID=434235 RepID=A0ACC0YN99_9ROSI|nr:hypothetical protein Pint_23291 [Pistacia integerrima]
MGSDQDTQRKHRRSTSDDEAEKSSKRHKHRHHHHRHRHHRSRRHEDETNRGGDDVAPSVPVINSSGIDDDVEEGEILEEDNFETKKLDSSEIKAVDLLDGVDPRIPGVGEFDHVKETPQNKIDDNLVANSGISEKVHNDHHVNGDFPREYRKDIDRRPRESVSPSRKSRKQKNYLDTDGMQDDVSKLRERRKSSSPESSVDGHKLVVRSPSCDRSNDDFHVRRSRSRSCDLALERSRSLSIMEEEAVIKRRRCHERDLNDFEDDRVIQRSRNERHGSRDLVRDEEREHSSSYCSRHIGREDSHRSREIHRERSWEREMEKERRREKERESSRNMEINRERRRDKERERSRDREIYSEREERGSGRYEEVDWGRKREKERDRSRDRTRVSDRDIGRHRERGRDKDTFRLRDHILERERERRSDRSRDKAGDIESGRMKYGSFDDNYGNRDRFKHSRHSTHDDDKGHFRDRTRRDDPAKVHSSNSHYLEGGNDGKTRDEDDEDDFEERVALKLVEQEEEDLERIKEESRKRRQAILEKYKNQQLLQHSESNLADVEKDKKSLEHPGLSTGVDNNFPDNHNGKNNGVDGYVDEQLFSVRKSPLQNGIAAPEGTSGPGGLGDGTPKSETSDLVFCDDIFGETPTGVRKSGKAEGSKIIRSGLHDNWDDAEGYYSHRFGELLDGRYEVTAAHGKGVFSTVVRAKDLKAGIGEPEEVAIKIIRNNETMNKAGQTEVQILKKLAGADPENKRHCVRFISNFKYRNHLCLVFESLHMNLREVLKKFGRNIGLKLTAVRAYGKQLFIALKHLKNCGVLHCDIKPDNMLVNEAKNVLKLCDFGNAMFAGKNEITPYLVSRFYRAPEIILGLPYDHPLDIWSVGCCLYELYTGKVLFPGATNNDMLRLHMELKGPFPKKMLRKGAFTEQHFDQDLNFHATEEDPVTKKTIKRMIFNIKPKDIGSIVTTSPGEDPKMLNNFKDLLEKIFVLDPEKRMTVAQALAHPFISGK